MENKNQFQPQTQPTTSEQKPKKPWYKKWWIWVIIGVVVTGTIGAVMPKNTKDKSAATQTTTVGTTETTVAQDKKATEAPTEKATEAPTKSAEEEKTAFINSCETIDYATLARNPDKYKDKNYKMTGQVIQVLDSDSWFDNSTTLRINVTATPNEFAEGGYLWDDTIVATINIPEGADRILENDIIDFYGTCAGLYSYTSVLGQKISTPRIDIKYYTIK